MAQKKDNDLKGQIDTLDSKIAELKSKGKVYGSRAGEQILQQDIITTSSFEFDQRLGGGFRASSWSRVFAEPELGKTSMGLCWGANWQKKYPDDGFVAYFNAEGRITKDLIERSAIDTSRDKFRIIDGNNYEATLDIIHACILNNKENRRYFVILDCTDAFERDVDSKKGFMDAEKVGGGALMLSIMGKRMSILSNLSGHHIFICSQVRDKVSIGGPARGGGTAPSGGKAVRFYSSLSAEIRKPWGKNWLRENPSDDKSRIIGKLCEIKLDKTPNETTGTTVYYPVKYGLKGGVWRAYESMLVAQACGILRLSGAWFDFEPSMFEDMKSKNITVPVKTQGERAMRDVFDSNPELVEYIFDRAKIIYSADFWIKSKSDKADE